MLACLYDFQLILLAVEELRVGGRRSAYFLLGDGCYLLLRIGSSEVVLKVLLLFAFSLLSQRRGDLLLGAL